MSILRWSRSTIFCSIENERKLHFRLHLVLIKPKIEQLRGARPLKIFSNSNSFVDGSSRKLESNFSFNDFPVSLSNNEILEPRQLIERYQLNKLHLAFTICKRSNDGSDESYPETTLISNVLTDISTAEFRRQTSKSKEKQSFFLWISSWLLSIAQSIQCPSCSRKMTMPRSPTDFQSCNLEKRHEIGKRKRKKWNT